MPTTDVPRDFLPVSTTIVVAGHACVDITPRVLQRVPVDQLLHPGRLLATGPAEFGVGGAVPNVACALSVLLRHTAGVGAAAATPAAAVAPSPHTPRVAAAVASPSPPRIVAVAPVADDDFGVVLRRQLKRWNVADDGIVTVPAPPPSATAPTTTGPHAPRFSHCTSYSVILSPPGADRCILHCPGVNDAVAPSVLAPHVPWADAGVLYVGYPPLLAQWIQRDGAPLRAFLDRAVAQRVTTVLDMTSVDTEATSINWSALFRTVLPAVAFFAPSIEEITHCRVVPLTAAEWAASTGAGNDASVMYTLGHLRRVAHVLLECGAAVVVLKLGPRGMYLKTRATAGEHLGRGAAACDAAAWNGAEVYAPCFDVAVAGTTGAGDCAVAALMVAVCAGFGPSQALQFACAVGAFNVEAVDAVSGLAPVADVLGRIRGGWRRHGAFLPELKSAAPDTFGNFALRAAVASSSDAGGDSSSSAARGAAPPLAQRAKL